MYCETEDLFGSYPPYIESTACSFSLIGDDSRMIIIKFSSNYYITFNTILVMLTLIIMKALYIIFSRSSRAYGPLWRAKYNKNIRARKI